MGMTVLLGGARSGKSEMASGLATTTDRPVVVVATAEARDEEMAERIRHHRNTRPSTWTTLEVPVELGAAVRDLERESLVVLDCLSLWVSNLIEAGLAEDAIVTEAREVATLLATREAPAIVVSNEVGLGIVPVNALARRYRDALGRVNATFASAAYRAYFVVAGKALPLEDVNLA